MRDRSGDVRTNSSIPGNRHSPGRPRPLAGIVGTVKWCPRHVDGSTDTSTRQPRGDALLSIGTETRKGSGSVRSCSVRRFARLAPAICRVIAGQGGRRGSAQGRGRRFQRCLPGVETGGAARRRNRGATHRVSAGSEIWVVNQGAWKSTDVVRQVRSCSPTFGRRRRSVRRLRRRAGRDTWASTNGALHSPTRPIPMGS